MNACQGLLQVLGARGEHPIQEGVGVGDIRNTYTAFLKECQVGLGHLLDAFAEESPVNFERLQELVEGAKDRDPKFKIEAERAVAEVVLAKNEEARDVGTRQPEVGELGDAGGEGSPHVGAEDSGVLGDDGGDLGAGEAEVREEGEDRVGVGGVLEVGDPLRRLEGLLSGEAAGGDEVVLDGEGVWGDAFGGGQEAVGREERGYVGGRDGGWGPKEVGEDALPEVDHGAAAAAWPAGG